MRHVFVRFAKAGTIALSLITAMPAIAGWKLVPHDAPVRMGQMEIVPLRDWNSASAKPGQQGASWTQDGFDLNRLDVFAGIPSGKSIYRERNAKRNPMPKFASTMLLIDLADLFERSFRANNDVTDFTVVESSPSKLAGQPAVDVRYAYTLPGDELHRKGEARIAMVDGALYLINYQAPDLHYFEAGVSEAHAIMDGARLTNK